MANTTIRFNVSGLAEMRESFRLLALQLAHAKAKRRERRAYLNMLRSTRRTRKTMVRKWMLAKLHVKVCEIRIECPTTEVRIASEANVEAGFPVSDLDTMKALKAATKIGSSTWHGIVREKLRAWFREHDI